MIWHRECMLSALLLKDSTDGAGPVPCGSHAAPGCPFAGDIDQGPPLSAQDAMLSPPHQETRRYRALLSLGTDW